MAEGGPPAPQLPPVCSPLLSQLHHPPLWSNHLPLQYNRYNIQFNQHGYRYNQANLPLNWSYFKPEFSGKPEEDAEADLLRTNDWMETHNFPDVAKVQRFCLTLTDEARLWYESLKHIVVDWQGLQDQFRQQYLKFCNMWEQLFYVWRSFHYDENVER